MTPLKKRSQTEEKLLSIVNTWKISKDPEYRGFRCANCQGYIHKAYQYPFYGVRFKVAIHLCSDCNNKLGFSGKEQVFSCSNCKKRVFKAYHVWNSEKGRNIEAHFCRTCGKKLLKI